MTNHLHKANILYQFCTTILYSWKKSSKQILLTPVVRRLNTTTVSLSHLNLKGLIGNRQFFEKLHQTLKQLSHPT